MHLPLLLPSFDNRYSRYGLPLLLFLCLIFAGTACQGDKKAFSVKDVPDPKQMDGGYISNPDNLLSASAVANINASLSSLDQEGRAQVAVVLLRTIAEHDPRDFAHELFNYWKIGDKEKNNGLLILMVEDQRKLVFETGYGLEGDMPDILCFRIQQEYMIPHIRNGEVDAAFMQGVESVIALLHTGNYVLGAGPMDGPVAVNDPSLMTPGKPAPPVVEPVPAPPSPIPAPSLPASDPAPVEPGIISDRPGALSDEPIGIDPPGPVAPQSFADNYPQEEERGSHVSRTRSAPGIGTFVAFVFGFILSSAFMTVAFGRKARKRHSASDPDTPVSMRDLPNEFLPLGAWGVLLVNGMAFGIFTLIYRYTYWWVNFVTVIICYYLALTLFVHVAVLIIRLRIRPLLAGADEHTRYQTLNLAHRYLDKACYAFPLPFLLPYMKAVKRQMVRLRSGPFDCPSCHKPMVLMDEATDNKFLQKYQVVEEDLMSVDYDVWECAACDGELILDYPNILSQVASCPKCAHKTYQMIKDQVVRRATTSSEGYGHLYYVCGFCSHNDKYEYTIPKESKSSSGGSSSSSSSSSSSWGGGSSGGGGASSSW
ncbi:TPM domain-containing protein [Chitinophaga defluvii]|uniref:TPM domain-containing protein n=1 Tax=Chitinophaga defluvii TaxID=3163343 RepID=A0ABV2THJ6_9BACT